MLYASKKMVYSRYNRTDEHMSSQRLWQHAHGLHKFNPDRVPAQRGRSGNVLPPLTKKLSAADMHLQRKT